MSNFPRLDETGLTYLVNKLAEKIRPNKNVQSDWNESDSTSDAYIKNKQVITNQVQDMNNVLGAKNLLPYPYIENRSSINGMTYVINSDGSVTFNGTATANVYFNCNLIDFGDVPFNSRSSSNVPYIATLENGSNDIYLGYDANSKSIFIRINSGIVCENLTVYPMIRLRSIVDDTYEPYAKTNQQLTADVKNTGAIEPMLNVLGAKNLLPNNAVTQTKSGITFTVNSDGSIRLTGTATENVYINLPVDLTDGVTYTASGISGGAVNTYQVTLRTESGGLTSQGELYYGEVTFTKNSGQDPSNNHDVHIYRIRVSSGTTVDTVIYPMIRFASITDNTYVPYAKTNKQLTEDIKEINSQLGSIDYDGAGAHNSIYRGKYLGAEVTAAQYTAISSGKFTDLYIGDYWTIGGVNYRIGAFDYWYNTGNTACTTHHVLLVPDTSLASGQINSTNTTGGYAGSDLKTGNNSNTALATAKSTINNAFGSSHILSHREYFTNAVANGKPSAGAWYDSDIDLMNENMVYGTNIFLPHPDGSTVPDLYTIDKTQIKLFAERPDLITIRADWWLRDVVSAVAFVAIAGPGYVASRNVSSSLGVRPAFGLIA